MAESHFKVLSALIPKYDGNQKRLNYYINEVDKILSLFDLQGPVSDLIVQLIKNRLEGEALDAIANEPNVHSWDSVKEVLRRRLGDPRNEVQVMQELTHLRRNRNEDSASFGKRVREVLDTVYSVGAHTDKTYYEKMAIEQYINQLEFHVSIGVKITAPATLEAAIYTARQEEARLANNPPSNPVNSQKPRDHIKTFHQSNNQHPNTSFSPRFNQPGPSNRSFPPMFNTPFTQQRSDPSNNTWPTQQSAAPPMQPWRNQQFNTNSGRFRNSGNFRSQQQNIPREQVDPPQKVSDVTMRSVGKPKPSPFTSHELFYMPNNHASLQYNCNNDQVLYEPQAYESYDFNPTCDEQPCEITDIEDEGVRNTQNFSEGPNNQDST